MLLAFRLEHDLGHHLDRLDRILAGGGLRREHHRVGAVVDGVGHVAGLGPRGAGIFDHRLQHLGGRDDRLAIIAGPADHMLLNGRHLLRRHFDPQVSARDHDPVGGFEDAFQVLNGLRLFELGDDPGLGAHGGHAMPHQPDVFRGAHEGDGDGVHSVADGELQILFVLGGQGRYPHRDARQVDALVLAQHAAVDHLALRVLPVHGHHVAAQSGRRRAGCALPAPDFPPG